MDVHENRDQWAQSVCKSYKLTTRGNPFNCGIELLPKWSSRPMRTKENSKGHTEWTHVGINVGKHGWPGHD